jgi:hypothetical protein
MLTDAQQAAGALRLEGEAPKHLTASDVLDLAAALRLWLGSRASEFSDVETRLRASSGVKAEKLAGVLILLKGLGSATSFIRNGPAGFNDRKADQRILLHEFLFGLLYESGIGRGPVDNATLTTGSTSTPNKAVL